MEPMHDIAPSPVPDAAGLLALALSVVRPAAALAREMRMIGIAGVATKSSDTDVVTAADRAVERQVREALAAVRPYDRVLGEEFGGEPPTGRTNGASSVAPGAPAGVGSVGSAAAPAVPDWPATPPQEPLRRAPAVRWIIDPIDGTVNYLYGLPHYAVSLAAEVDGEVVAGVVCNAATGQEWTATLGGGAYAGDRRLSGSSQTRLSLALVATGFGYDAARRAHQAKVLAGLLNQIRDIRRLGSAAIDLCLAADGAIDAFYEKGLNAWDHAAGGLVAREAGLLVTGLAGAPPGPDLVIAAPPALHGQLHEQLVRLDAAGGP